MQPVKISFYVYAHSDDAAANLERALRAFVENHRQKGIAVTAERLTDALRTFADNYFVNQYLKK
jgi:L-asparaginase/Glu-tRNA(Gln) amidotransferase subunit D